MTIPAGVSIAFDNDALDDPVTWTRIDNYPGVNIQSITIDRGRTDPTSKTMPGTATITGMDLNGILDPTNTTGPFYGKLNPVKQAAVSLYNPVTNTWNYLFRGYIAEIIHDLDLSENFSNVEIDLVDMLDLINDSEVIPDSSANFTPQENIGDTFYTGQHVDDRILAVLEDAAAAFGGTGGWPGTLLEIASGNVWVQGRAYSNQTSLLQVIDEACDAESPYATNRFITTGGSFAFRGRYYRFVPDYYTAFDYNRRPNHELIQWSVADARSWMSGTSTAIINGLKFQRGKTNLINAALVTPVGINTNDIAAQAEHDSTSISKYGPRTDGMSLENLIMSAGDDGNNAKQEANSFAKSIVQNYKNPLSRVSELTVTNPDSNTGDAATNTWAFLCGVELSDLVGVNTQHPGGGGFNGEQYYVEKIGYQIDPLQGDVWQVVLTIDTTPRANYAVMPGSWNPPEAGGIFAAFTYVASFPTVTFTDTSTPGPSGPITAWLWNFGDGGTSTLQNPVHTYGSDVLHYVTLKVTGTGADGSDTGSQGVNFPS